MPFTRDCYITAERNGKRKPVYILQKNNPFPTSPEDFFHTYGIAYSYVTQLYQTGFKKVEVVETDDFNPLPDLREEYPIFTPQGKPL